MGGLTSRHEGRARNPAEAAAAVRRNVKWLRRSLADVDAAETPDPILPTGITRLLLRLFGRPIVCAECGRRMFVALPLVWRGRLWMIGAYDNLFHVSFVSSERMEFRHGQLDQCPAASRPWVE